MARATTSLSIVKLEAEIIEAALSSLDGGRTSLDIRNDQLTK